MRTPIEPYSSSGPSKAKTERGPPAFHPEKVHDWGRLGGGGDRRYRRSGPAVRSMLKTSEVLGSRQRSRVPEEKEILRDACRAECWIEGNGVQDADDVGRKSEMGG